MLVLVNMLALLVLTVVASASAIPAGEKKILPIYEYPLVSKTIDAGVALRSWCLDDCHHHVIDKPVFIMRMGKDGQTDIQFYPLGLNSLGRSPIKEQLMSGKMVAMITPLAKFPQGKLADLTVTIPATTELTYKFSDMYKEAPVMILLTEEEFNNLSKTKMTYTHLADLTVDDQGFSMSKEYPLPQATGVVSKWGYASLFT